jgi:hypothetical protein
MTLYKIYWKGDPEKPQIVKGGTPAEAMIANGITPDRFPHVDRCVEIPGTKRPRDILRNWLIYIDVIADTADEFFEALMPMLSDKDWEALMDVMGLKDPAERQKVRDRLKVGDFNLKR